MEACPGLPLSQGDNVIPMKLRNLWKSMGSSRDVFEFNSASGSNFGRGRCFSNAFEQARPFQFTMPESISGYCPRLFDFDRRITCTFAEKAIMLCKAAIMNDERMFDEIVKTTCASKARALGKRVASWNETLWQRMVCTVAYQVVYQKFSQMPELRVLLLQTGSQLIADSARNDSLWGVGLEPGDPKVRFPSHWAGANVLGWALCQARATIRAEAVSSNAGVLVSQPSLRTEIQIDAAPQIKLGAQENLVPNAQTTLTLDSDAQSPSSKENRIPNTQCVEKLTSQIEPASCKSVIVHEDGVAASTEERSWERFVHDDGSERGWWYNNTTGEFFFEDTPGLWERWLFADPGGKDPSQLRGWWCHNQQPDRWFLEP